MRTATAAILATALVCLPVVLDQCTGSCEASQLRAASAPPCHEGHSTGPQYGRAPAGCSHEHSVSTGSVKNVSPVPPSTSVVIAAPDAFALSTNRRPFAAVSTHAPPGSAGPIHASSLPLRV